MNPKNRFLVLLLIIIFLSLFFIDLPEVKSQNSVEEIEQKINQEKTELEKLKTKIVEKGKEIHKVEDKEVSILSDLGDIENLLAVKEKELEIYNWNLKKDEKEIKLFQEDLLGVQDKLAKQAELLKKRLRYIYKQGEISLLQVLFSTSEYLDVLKQVKYMKVIAQYDNDLINSYRKQIQKIGNLKSDLEDRKKRIIVFRKKTEETKEEIENKKIDKELILTNIRDKKASYEKVIIELENASDNLQVLIEILEQDKEDKLCNVRHFRKKKGALIWPIDGEVIGFFGKIKHPKFNTYTFHKGIDIKAQKGSEVIAVCEGTVVYADWLKGYGKLAIIDHGDGYYTLYAHNSELLVKNGDEVEQKQIIAKAGETGSLKGPCLYFEIRYQGKPEDPMEWLKKRGLTGLTG